jgi:hypothetical protein
MTEPIRALTIDATTGEQTIREVTAEEIKQNLAQATNLSPEDNEANLRSTRNRLLAETDYLALADHTLSAEMTAYRQALRDLPANTADPANPVWPVKPGGDS